MNRIAVFGKPGGGKSTLGRRLSSSTGIELYALDMIEYRRNGERVAPEEYSRRHGELIAADRWIIDGLGPLESFWARIDAADTLVFVDLPYPVHYWWITKRLLKSVFARPEGWPDGSSVFKGTWASWKYLRMSPAFWNAALLRRIQSRSHGKKLYRITTVRELNHFSEQTNHAGVHT